MQDHIQPRMVRQILTNRSKPQPATIATPTGGNSMVTRTIRRAGAASLMFAVSESLPYFVNRKLSTLLLFCCCCGRLEGL